MVTLAKLLARLACSGFARLTRNLSRGSCTVSSMIGTEMILTLSPGKNSSTPDVSV